MQQIRQRVLAVIAVVTLIIGVTVIPAVANGEGHDSSHIPHDFVEHVTALLGTDVLAPGQHRIGGFYTTRDNDRKVDYRGQSPITGLRPVIEQAIDTVRAENPKLRGEKLERAIAKELTGLNDWEDLEADTQHQVSVLTGVDWGGAVSAEDRERTINHLLHSPLPFGQVENLDGRRLRVNLKYTHTLDKDHTTAVHLGDNRWEVYMISNNNDGSHTGHNLGSIVLQAESMEDAIARGNKLVKNKNNNDKLSLASAAADILYNRTPRLAIDPNDQSYVGRGL